MTDLARVSRDFAAAADGRKTRRELESSLERRALRLAGAVRGAIRSIPANGKGSTGLRARMAKAVTVRTWTRGRTVGVTLSVDGKKMPSGQRSLPAYMEGEKAPWRHPVHGNTSVWVRQKPHPYFYPTVRRRADRAARSGVDDALRSVTDGL